MYDSSSDVAVHVEIKDYSIAYFDHIAAFEALYCWTSIEDGPIRSSWMFSIFMHPQNMHESHLNWSLRYGTLNAAKQLKYVTK